MLPLLDQLTNINAIKDLLVPALTALATLWIAMRKFRKEKIWQEKYAAYQRVIIAIEEIRYWADEASSEASMLPTVGWFDGKSSQDFYAEARRQIAKQCSIGTLLMSRQVVNELVELQKRIFKESCDASENYNADERDEQSALGDHATELRKIVDSHLPRILAHARDDLGA